MFVDNYEKTQLAIARYILDHATRGLREQDRASLERFLQDPKEGRIHGLEFRALSRRQVEEGEKTVWGDLDCTLYVTLDWDRKDRQKDEEGNVWLCHEVKAEVNWPSWGSTRPGLAGERISFMDEVCQLARNIEANFSEPVWQLVETKAEVDARIAASLAKRREETVQKAVISEARQMRVGQSRSVHLPQKDHELFTSIQPRFSGGPVWEGVVSWGRPNGDVWKFMARVVNGPVFGSSVYFSRTE